MSQLPRVNNRWNHSRPDEVVLLDNRDSFVFNLAHRFAEVGVEVVVERSDQIDLDELISWSPKALVLSPGPGHPDSAGISVEAVQYFTGKIPILGICLGHQVVARAWGAKVRKNQKPVHGKSSPIKHSGEGLFTGIDSPFEAGRYHSLVVERPLPAPLNTTATSDGFVMGIAHAEHPVYGLQFHPESVLTPVGRRLLENFASDYSLSSDETDSSAELA